MHRSEDCPQVPVSWGELIDKITILRLKQDKIRDPAARANVARELGLLVRAAADIVDGEPLTSLTRELQAVNAHLWDIEDAIRECEAARDFGGRFIALARSVYHENDRRAALKRAINRALGSALVEEKSYSAVQPTAVDLGRAAAFNPAAA